MNSRLAMMGMLAGAAMSCAGVPLPKEQLTDPGALLFNGYVRPDIDCFSCHNGDAKGARAPSLARETRSLSAEKLGAIIRQGPGPMPAYGKDVLGDEELAQIVGWLKASFPAP
ncbi:MAG: c-type cytochrome [Myxococcota bacterium]